MYQNYTNRVKNFILDMINPDTQITINDNKNYNKEKLDKRFNNETFVQKTPFIFKGYANEKERILEHIKNNPYLNGIYYYDNDGKNQDKIEENSKNKIFQNKLKRNKYKALSPFSKMNISNQFSLSEKSINLSQTNNISETMNNIFSNKFENKLNLKSFINFRNNKYNKINTLSKENKSDYYTTNNNRPENNHKKYRTRLKQELKEISQYISKTKHMGERNSYKKEMKLNDNYNSFNSFTNKLYFKAAEEVAENKTDRNNKNLLLLPNLFKRNKSINNNLFSYDEKEENKTHNIILEDEYYNNLFYKNPINEQKNKKLYNPKLLEKLSKMAFENKKSKKNLELENKKKIEINKTFNKGNKKLKFRDENEVEIDGEIFEKNTQFNLITKKMLKICKVISNKSTKNRNKLRAGLGKNMMTKGLSVNNFIKKYNLK